MSRAHSFYKQTSPDVASSGIFNNLSIGGNDIKTETTLSVTGGFSVDSGTDITLKTTGKCDICGNLFIAGNNDITGDLSVNGTYHSLIGSGVGIGRKYNDGLGGRLQPALNVKGSVTLAETTDANYPAGSIIYTGTQFKLGLGNAGGGDTVWQPISTGTDQATIFSLDGSSAILNTATQNFGVGVPAANIRSLLHVGGEIRTDSGFYDNYGYDSNIQKNITNTISQSSSGYSNINCSLADTDISFSIFKTFDLNQEIDGSGGTVATRQDLTSVDLAFASPVFDGRYVYNIPSTYWQENIIGATSKNNTWFIRYDTMRDINSSNSYTAIDLSAEISTDLSGCYKGGLFMNNGTGSNSSIYLAPFTQTYSNKNSPNNVLVKYNTDTTFQNIKYSSPWIYYDLCGNVGSSGNVVGGYNGIVSDGKYLYYIPGVKVSENNQAVVGLTTHSTFIRYDIDASFLQPASYSTFTNTAQTFTNQNAHLAYSGGCFDGKYVYFAPYKKTDIVTGTSIYQTHGKACRYNTHEPFDNGTSWEYMDLSSSFNNTNTGNGWNLTGFSSCIYDGRYVYYVPYEKCNFSGAVGDFRWGENTTIARFDTKNPSIGGGGGFNLTSAWNYFNISDAFASTHMKGGFYGAIFDGKYIWYIPSAGGFVGDNEGTNNNYWSSLLVKYDTHQSFTDPSAYYSFNMADVNADCGGYRGASFDGRYIYLSPYRTKTGTGGRNNGLVTRVDTGAPTPNPGISSIAVSKNFFMNKEGNIGIGTKVPTKVLDISGDICGNDLYISDIYANDICANDICANNIYVNEIFSERGLIYIDDISGDDASFVNLTVDRITAQPAALDGSAALVIDSSLAITGGNVCIGTDDARTILSITPNDYAPKITLWDGGNSGSHYGFGVSNGNLNYQVPSTKHHVFRYGGKNNDGTVLMTLKANSGDLEVKGDITAYYSSDRRLKTNIRCIENSLEKISSISGYEFDWANIVDINNNRITKEGNDMGVIAQEIESICPQIVTTRDNGYLAVKYEKLIPVLIEGIKELKNKVNTLEKTVDDLQANV